MILAKTFKIIDGHIQLYDESGNEVAGDFDCSYNNLTTFEGCPHTIGRDFSFPHLRFVGDAVLVL